MEVWLVGMERFDWLVPALCEFVALLAGVGLVRVLRPRAAAVAPTRSDLPSARPEVKAYVTPVQSTHADSSPLKGVPCARVDVRRALDAIGRWEHHYGSARGITELARWVEGQKHDREANSSR